jgi:hypothetical protein
MLWHERTICSSVDDRRESTGPSRARLSTHFGYTKSYHACCHYLCCDIVAL